MQKYKIEILVNGELVYLSEMEIEKINNLLSQADESQANTAYDPI